MKTRNQHHESSVPRCDRKGGSAAHTCTKGVGLSVAQAFSRER